MKWPIYIYIYELMVYMLSEWNAFVSIEFFLSVLMYYMYKIALQSKRWHLIKIRKVKFHIKPISSYIWWECEKYVSHVSVFKIYYFYKKYINRQSPNLPYYVDTSKTLRYIVRYTDIGCLKCDLTTRSYSVKHSL